jgi:hypothetical protein
VTERSVRFTEGFFDRLEELLPTERGADGTPSITDFLVFEIPGLRDRLAVMTGEVVPGGMGLLVR